MPVRPVTVTGKVRTNMIKITEEYLLSQGLNHTFPQRFWAKVDKSGGPDACWPFMGCRHHGYGQINPGYFKNKPSKPMPAHVAAHILSIGPVPPGLYVLHKCPGKHNKACCNPSHLKAGPSRENSYDRLDQITKGFLDKYNGRQCVKLNWEKAEQIRALYDYTKPARGQHTKLGRMFGVTRHTIGFVVRNQTWVRPSAAA